MRDNGRAFTGARSHVTRPGGAEAVHERGPVASQAAVAVRQPLARRVGSGHLRVVTRLARGVERVEYVVELLSVEHLRHPPVERADGDRPSLRVVRGSTSGSAQT